MEIDKLRNEIDKQRDININLYKSIPVASHEDPNNEKADPILKQWREGSKKIKKLIEQLHVLEDAEKAATPETTVKESHTGVNGFGEATAREITCATYERAQKRLDKEIMSFIGGR
ncbi:MAG: hypothetical protein ACRC3H_19590 [Lachnospiraceae bacterium]